MADSFRSRTLAGLLTLSACVSVASIPSVAVAKGGRCPAGMVPILAGFCIDPYESAVEQKQGRKWVAHSPYESVKGKQVRAVSKRGVVPQAYISRNEAEDACKASRKRLCSEQEWLTACRGRKPTRWPYGNDHKTGYCNDAGASPLNHYYGTSSGVDPTAYGWGPMNDPRLNRFPGSLAKTGAFRRCTNGFKVFDMVGNLHEWIDEAHGTFRGGYYLDTKINGEGCDYKTVAHDASYHDYSTGFRCCADTR